MRVDENDLEAGTVTHLLDSDYLNILTCGRPVTHGLQELFVCIQVLIGRVRALAHIDEDLNPPLFWPGFGLAHSVWWASEAPKGERRYSLAEVFFGVTGQSAG